MSLTRKRAVAGLSLAVAATGLMALPASANPGGTGLVISEVYLNGGSSGATYTNKFVELYNPTGAAIDLTGLSVQYRSPTGVANASSAVALSGSVPSHDYFVLQGGSNGANGAAVPNVDQVSSLNPGGGGGTVFIATGTTAINPGTGSVTANASVADLVGWGSSNTFETTVTTAASVTTSLQRSETGGVVNSDTDVNSTDLTALAPSPGAAYTPPPPPDTFTGSIAEIQGTDAAVSPHAGDIATTRGVVTAAYPTGGFNGFYLQTEGTGGDTDATPGASDAIFVYGSAATATVTIGDFVEVTGPVSEFSGTTEITPAGAADVVQLADAHDPVTPLAAAYPTTEATREAHEGELLAPTDTFTVTNTYSTNQYAEIGLATGNTPLIAPTEVADAQDAPAIADVVADNAARAVALDDAASTNFLSAANQATPLPWLSPTNPIRVGAKATLHAPVIMEFRNNAWKFQPTSQVTDEGADVATFQNTRVAAPEAVPGNLHIATFNVLNYFNTTGVDFVNAGGSCTYYSDRVGNPVTDNTCSPDGPRGAAEAEDLQRQQDKIVAAVNALGADIVSLEEIENSVKMIGETNRDDALSTLVDALNGAAGSDVWAYAPSPAAADLPDLATQDVIRTAFIYKPAQVDLVGASQVLVGSAAFNNARQPLAQAFKPAGTADAEAFAVIVNHFKSKGSGVDDGTGQGNANPDRVNQAGDLVTFADSFAADRGTDKVFLTGDFNSYSQEDPMQVLYAADYTPIESDTPDEWTYSFSGLSGSLDHVLANPAALGMVAGADIWGINSGESVAFEYSRHNYNVTDFYQPNMFRASDHDPEIVGLNVNAAPGPVTLNLLGVNDFHGRINNNTVKWAGTVEQLTEQGGADSTLLVGAGDLIGASEFPSSVQQDQPTIDMFNALGLDASAVGNHEFDQGWADLRDRVIGAPGARNAQWDYLGANVYAKGTTDPVLPEYATFDVDGVTVGVIGAVTEETSSLVSPGGIADIEFGNPVDALNRVAGELSDGDPANGEADVIVASFHAGATQGVGSNYAAEIARGGEFAEMANLDPAVDVIFNGHTHQAYAWDAPVPGDPTKTRPIIQTGSYGSFVGQVQLTVDPTTGDVSAYTVRNVARTTVADAVLVAAYPRVAQVKTIVDDALAYAAEIGNEPVGSITDDITTAFTGGSYVGGTYTGGVRDDRASESTLGDLVGNALRDGVPGDIGTADLGIVNPGGLRAELSYAGDTTTNPANTDGVVTYAEANGVLPFINNIWLVDVTGAQLKQVLEQQWQTNPDGTIPGRPYLQLGLSDNVQLTADASKPMGSRITSVLIDGEPLDPAATYTVSTFSFLGTGGDNFRAFTQGTARDTGLVDRDLWIQYLRDHADLAPDFARQQVAESGMPTTVYAGQHVEFSLSTLDLTSQGSPANTTVNVTATDGPGTTVALGEFPVTNGAADLAFDVPALFAAGGTITVSADPSGTTVTIPVGEVGASTVAGSSEPFAYGQAGTVTATVTPDTATGTVELRRGGTVLDTATVSGGTAELTLAATALDPGTYPLTLHYSGDGANGAADGSVSVTVTKAAAEVAVTVSPSTLKVKKDTATAEVSVSADGVVPTGYVGLFVGGSLVRAAALTSGAASLVVGPFTSTGTQSFEVRYLGDDFVEPASATASVVVTKARPHMRVIKSPMVVHAKRTHPVLDVRL